MNDHQPKTFMGIDLAATSEASRTPIVAVMGIPVGFGMPAGVTDLGVSVEEAPEAPQDSPARRVTAEGIEAKIAQEDYIEGINGRLTVCVLTLANGFLVTGESACVDSVNYDAALGRKIARANAFDKLWPLEGYLLRDKIEAERVEALDATEARAANEGYCDSFGMDGAKWAAGFRKTAISLGYSAMDEGWLIGWFCNAVMAGYDEARRRYEPADVSPAPKADTGRAADEGWDDPEAVADFHANALIGTQSVAGPYTDREWLRQRALELAQVAHGHLDTKDLIERARQIEDYIAGKPEPEAVTEAAPPTDAQLIQRAKDVLVDAVTRGEAPACDQAGDAIQAMADWLNDVAVAG